MSGQEDNDYIPSQDVGVVDGSSTDRARRGPALAMATHRLDELYCAGGPLDSQTTDSQFVNKLQEEPVESPKHIPPPALPARMPEPEKFVVSEDEKCNGNDICECTRNKRTLYALEERIENLEATLHDTRRTVEKLERDIEVLKSGSQCSDSDDSDADDKIPVYDFGGEVVWMKKDYPSQVIVSPPHSKRVRLMRTARLSPPQFRPCLTDRAAPHGDRRSVLSHRTVDSNHAGSHSRHT